MRFLSDRLNWPKQMFEAPHSPNVVKVLNKELESEMARTKMDISSMDVRIKGEYIARLKVEVDILRGTYDKFMKDTWEQLEAEYKERLAKLELELTLLLNQQSSLEDAGAIK